jgi:hypothetical protein
MGASALPSLSRAPTDADAPRRETIDFMINSLGETFCRISRLLRGSADAQHHSPDFPAKRS